MRAFSSFILVTTTIINALSIYKSLQIQKNILNEIKTLKNDNGKKNREPTVLSDGTYL